MRAREARVVYGGRGMGKSVLLRSVAGQLGADGEHVIGIWHGDEAGSLRDALLAALDRPGAPSLVDEVEAAISVNGPLALLIDEADRWRDIEQTRRTLDQLGAAQRERLGGCLGLLVAGGIGAFRLASQPLGSPFASRINAQHNLAPMGMPQLEAWAQPLRQRDPAYDTAWLQAAHVASGGIPLLLAAALSEGWRCCDAAAPAPDPVAWLDGFLRGQSGFKKSVRDSVDLGRRDSPASRILAAATEMPGAVSLDALEDAGLTLAQIEDTVLLLLAAGLLRGDPEPDGDHLRISPMPSLLRFHRPPRARFEAAEAAVRAAVGELVHHQVDLFHGRGAGRTIVPEATLSAFLAVQLRAQGWHADREPQRGPGRTDITLRAANQPGEAVVEVKIWSRNDYQHIHAQLLSYLQADARLGVAVMVATTDVADADYAALLPQPAPPVQRLGVVSAWTLTGQGPHGQTVPIVHLLARLIPR